MTDLYQKLIRPLVFRMDAEDAHELVCGLLSWIENFPSFKKFIEIMVSAPKDEVSVLDCSFLILLGSQQVLTKMADSLAFAVHLVLGM